MKRGLRAFLVLALCLALSGGVGIPTGISVDSSTESTVTIVEAKQKLNKNFKKAMDEYLKFYKKYCKFMKKYKKSNNAAALLNDYTDFMKQAKKLDKNMKKWKKKKLNNAERAYYLKILKKTLKLLSTT